MISIPIMITVFYCFTCKDGYLVD